MHGTTSRVWRSPDSGLPAPSNGTFYSDLGFQNFMGLKPRPAGRRLASSPTSWASKPASTDAKSALDAFRADLPKMSQKMAESLDPAAVISWFWSVYPYTLGSYASAKVGQYTTMLEVASEAGSRRPPAICRRAYQQRLSRLHEWRRESGNRAATALIEAMALQKMSVQPLGGLR